MKTQQPHHRRFWLVDTTLRDGEQTPGVVFAAEEKRVIARHLAEIGVAEIEVGTPAMGPDERTTIRSIARLGLPCRLTAWCRAREEDLDDAARSEVDAVHVSLPTSDLHLDALGKDRVWVLKQLDRIVGRALKRFDYVSVGAQDASRSDVDFLVACAQAAEACGAARFRLADTVGLYSPVLLPNVIARLRQATAAIQIGFHGHNDLGMATANTVAAAMAGAASLDVTVGGLGERAGNAALEEVVMALEHAHGVSVGVDTNRLRALAALVADYSGVAIGGHKPIVGEEIFRHESGIHVRGMLRDQRTYEPFPPERVGMPNRQITLGKHSGRSAVAHVLAASGIQVDEAEAARLVSLVRRVASRKDDSREASQLPAIVDTGSIDSIKEEI